MKLPFETVVDHHGATVMLVCRAVLGAHDDAEDAWQETFIALLRHLPDLPDATNLEAWLVTVAHRKAIDVTRRRRRHAVPLAELPETVSPHGNPPEPHDDIHAAVAALPTRQRLAVAYHHLGGLPHAEVAELIGGTPESVRRAASDGIRALRSEVTP